MSNSRAQFIKEVRNTLKGMMETYNFSFDEAKKKYIEWTKEHKFLSKEDLEDIINEVSILEFLEECDKID